MAGQPVFLRVTGVCEELLFGGTERKQDER